MTLQDELHSFEFATTGADSNVTVQGSTFRGNSASSSAQQPRLLSLSNALVSPQPPPRLPAQADSNVTVQGSTFRGNRANSSRGAAIFSGGSLLQVDDSLFEDNWSYLKGGAVTVEGSRGTEATTLGRFSNTTFTRNTSPVGGGAFLHWLSVGGRRRRPAAAAVNDAGSAASAASGANSSSSSSSSMGVGKAELAPLVCLNLTFSENEALYPQGVAFYEASFNPAVRIGCDECVREQESQTIGSIPKNFYFTFAGMDEGSNGLTTVPSFVALTAVGTPIAGLTVVIVDDYNNTVVQTIGSIPKNFYFTFVGMDEETNSLTTVPSFVALTAVGTPIAGLTVVIAGGLVVTTTLAGVTVGQLSSTAAKQRRQEYYNRLVGGVASWLDVCYMGILARVLPVFQSQMVGDTKVMLFAPEIEWLSSTHMGMLIPSIIILIVYLAGVPLLYAWLLFSAKALVLLVLLLVLLGERVCWFWCCHWCCWGRGCAGSGAATGAATGAAAVEGAVGCECAANSPLAVLLADNSCHLPFLPSRSPPLFSPTVSSLSFPPGGTCSTCRCECCTDASSSSSTRTPRWHLLNMSLRVLYGCILVFLYENPEAQIIILVVLQILRIVVEYRFAPFTSSSVEYLQATLNLGEVFFTLSLLIFNYTSESILSEVIMAISTVLMLLPAIVAISYEVSSKRMEAFNNSVLDEIWEQGSGKREDQLRGLDPYQIV
ncbi:unnamed protein product [Closterium sp. NIES-54]